MASVPYPYRALAARILVLCCAFWAFSFPVMKALQLLAKERVPDGSSVFSSAVCMMWRFGISTLVVGVILGRGVTQITRLEWMQGLIVGGFGSLGLLLQLDGLAYTEGSTSAFLTQGYCVLIPIWLAIKRRRLPSSAVWVSCTLAVVGAAVLVGLSWNDLRLGRGEWETLLSSVFFAAQIFWVEDPRFAGNHTLRWSGVMFGVMGITSLPLALFTAPRASDIVTLFGTTSALGLIAILIFGCTLVSFLLMNRWQRELPATEAGLLYCTEPVFTSLVCLVFPGWIARMTGLPYSNEVLSWNLVAGGGLILAANVWLQLKGTEASSPAAGSS